MALSRAAFFDRLRIGSYEFDLSENRRTSETGGGELLVSDLGPRLWTGTITCVPHYHREQRQILAIANSLRSGDGEFLMCDPGARFPTNDPDGTYRNVPGPQLLSWSGTDIATSVTVTPLTEGDYFSFNYGGGKVALHQVVRSNAPLTSNPDGSGQILEYRYTVTPGIRTGAVAGVRLQLYNASIKAVMVPGSFSAPENTLAASGRFSFKFRQTLR